MLHDIHRLALHACKQQQHLALASSIGRGAIAAKLSLMRNSSFCEATTPHLIRLAELHKYFLLPGPQNCSTTYNSLSALTSRTICTTQHSSSVSPLPVLHAFTFTIMSNTASNAPLVLITGGNGFIGSGIVLGALKAGYRVLAPVRREDAVDLISHNRYLAPYVNSGALKLTIIPSFTAPGALTAAAKDCTYIIHVASPLPTAEGDLIGQAVAGLQATLEAAEATPSVKRVVLTGSISCLRAMDMSDPSNPDNIAIASGDDAHVPYTTDDTQTPMQTDMPEDAPRFFVYNNSKLAMQHHVRQYVAAHPKSSFSIVSLHPGFVLGEAILVTHKADALVGSNMVFRSLFDKDWTWAPLFSLPANIKVPLPASTVHIDDVVEAHVRALEVEEKDWPGPGRWRNYLMQSDGPGGPVFDDAVRVVKTKLPKEIAAKVPAEGSTRKY